MDQTYDFEVWRKISCWLKALKGQLKEDMSVANDDQMMVNQDD